MNLPFQSPVQPGCWGNPCVESTAAHRSNITRLNRCNNKHSVGFGCSGNGLTSLYIFCSFSFSSGFMPADTFSKVRRQTSLFSPSVTILYSRTKSFYRLDLFVKATLISGVTHVRVFLKRVDLPVWLFVFVEIGFYDHCSTAVCLYGHQQTFILLLAQPDKIAHMHAHKHKWSGLSFSQIFSYTEVLL